MTKPSSYVAPTSSKEVAEKFNNYYSELEKNTCPKTPAERASKILTGVWLSGFSVSCILISFATFQTPAVSMTMLGCGINLAQQARRNFFPEYFCASDARRKLRSDYQIDKIEGETLLGKFGKIFGVGKSATIIKEREENLNKLLREGGVSPEKLEPPSLFQRFKTTLGFQKEASASDYCSVSDGIESPPATSKNEESNFSAEDQKSLETAKPDSVSKNEQPSASPKNPSGVTFFTWLKKIMGISFNHGAKR